MGDTGSLALGGALGTVAVLIKREFWLVLVGGVFVAETLSVMIQVDVVQAVGQARVPHVAAPPPLRAARAGPSRASCCASTSSGALLALLSLSTLQAAMTIDARHPLPGRRPLVVGRGALGPRRGTPAAPSRPRRARVRRARGVGAARGRGGARRARASTVSLGADDPALLEGRDFVVWSPGIPIEPSARGRGARARRAGDLRARAGLPGRARAAGLRSPAPTARARPPI